MNKLENNASCFEIRVERSRVETNPNATWQSFESCSLERKINERRRLFPDGNRYQFRSWINEPLLPLGENWMNAKREADGNGLSRTVFASPTINRTPASNAIHMVIRFLHRKSRAKIRRGSNTVDRNLAIA